jgi:thiosulfate/3-mercaptopyruvate sulfurtransferase
MEQEQGLSKLLSDSRLTDQYQAFKDQHVITYCNRGKQSALTYFTLRHLGYDVSVYDGAWLEWANDQNMPIE